MDDTTSYETTPPGAERQPDVSGGRHPVDVGHLVMGLAFAGMVAVWALVTTDVVGSGDVEWLLPLPWLVAGGGGLLAIVASTRRRR